MSELLSAGHNVRGLVVLAALTAAVLAFILLAPETVAAQCAMCQTAVQAGGDQSQRTMRTAMLVLLIPPVTIFCSIFIVVYKKRNQKDAASEEERDGGR